VPDVPRDLFVGWGTEIVGSAQDRFAHLQAASLEASRIGELDRPRNVIHQVTDRS